ncbi:DUF3558 domain-containing protein [Amycolatopsis cynarae]|uniref:DUF3558 domain-containing protein n=1 Tax=Amycolatopsis cynarae TaxID=2995223 RepID=A0ABY7B401_9PSEU|nr:DUF3558 domain-containing protein [Amycolatopsis sp. HUAS 11-8]WAL67035.1 DUF3558 domain-containing protein [Amycolatopsis sp. HUAS 11-8]
MTKRSRLFHTAAVLTALTLLAGCSEQTPGTPSSASTTPAANSAGTDDSSIPKVPRALDPSAYLDKPCDLVPRQLLSQLGYTAPGTPNMTNSTAGPACNWYMAGSSKNFGVGVQRTRSGQDNGGIAKIASLKGSLFSYVDMTNVKGYPAAFADTGDRRASGSCTLWVGITDKLTISASTNRYGTEQDSCGVARQVAGAVLDTLQGGS